MYRVDCFRFAGLVALEVRAGANLSYEPVVPCYFAWSCPFLGLELDEEESGESGRRIYYQICLEPVVGIL